MCRDTPLGGTSLPSTDRAPGIAREFVTHYLCRSHCAAVLEEVLLLTSEVVTNAFRYGGPPVGLTVQCHDNQVEVRVHDASSTKPRLVNAQDSEDHGRGVALIDMIATSWGVDELLGDGKDVWFRLDAPAEAA